MGKHRKTLDQIRDLNGGLHWRKVEALLRHLGAEFHQARGSAVRITLGHRKVVVDRPHPRPECGRGLVKRIRMLLEETGDL